MVFGRKDKLEGKIPDHFLAEVQDLKTTRDNTVDVVKIMEKMVKSALPPSAANANVLEQKAMATQQDELQKVGQTCENSMHCFYEQRYYYVLKTSSEVCNQLSKKQKSTIQEIYDRSMMPMKVWVEEEYPRFIRDLQRCAKLKKESDAANAAFAAKASPIKQAKAQNAKDVYEPQVKICAMQMEKERKVHKHHMNCLKLMAAMQHNYSKYVVEEVEKAQAKLASQLNSVEGQENKGAGSADSREQKARPSNE
ncbi:hypothetical protein M3Y97_00337100 [Aphelenchoides bicaudatus]|nr:hypothetical protein M3Y97_00337100 [Aphelenchoides bicaudatus]